MSDHEKIMRALKRETIKARNNPAHARESLISSGIMKKDGSSFSKPYKCLERLCEAGQIASK